MADSSIGEFGSSLKNSAIFGQLIAKPLIYSLGIICPGRLLVDCIQKALMVLADVEGEKGTLAWLLAIDEKGKIVC
jgi:hypothetical protein